MLKGTIECDFDSSDGNAWEGNIKKLKEAIINPPKKDGWHPRLVLSVVGDSSSFVPKPWLTPVFQLGLIETAKGAKDCVILFKGSNERVSTLVKKAVDDFSVMNKKDDDTFISLIALQPDDKEKKKTEGTGEENTVSKENQTSKTVDTDTKEKKKTEGTGEENTVSKENQTSKTVDTDTKEKKKTEGTGEENTVSKENQTSKTVDTDTKNNNPVVETHFKLKDSSKDYRMKMKTYGKFYAEVLESVAKEYIPLVITKEYIPLAGVKLSMNVPVVVLVAEGDLNTLDVVVEVLEKCIPVLILQGSGKAADLIAECMEEEENKYIKSIEAKAPLLLGIYFREEEFNRLKSCMDKIKKRKHFVNIFDITKHDETEFSDVVVSSIIRGWAQGEKTEPLADEDLYNLSTQDRYTPPETATASNYSVNNSGTNGILRPPKSNRVQPETAVPLKLKLEKVEELEKFMSNYEKSLIPASLPLYFYIAYQFIQKKTDLKENNFQILLKQAIIADRVDYVTVLLQEENVQFRKEDFPKIYEVIGSECRCTSDGDCQHVKSILKGASEKATETLLGNDKVIEAGRHLCQKFLHYPKSEKEKEYENPQEIYQDLLIWSLFANRPQMATLFWMKCENQLLTAILARCVLRKMATIARRGKDRVLFDAFTEHESVFEKRANDLQTKLYKEDPELAMELMLAEQTVWGIKVTPLECAFDNVMLDFIAHSCAQRRLNKIWYRKIGTGYGNFFKNGCLSCCKKEKGSEEENFVIFRFLYAPLTRFLVHYIIFLAALVCFSAFLLIELSEYTDVKSIKIYEWVIYAWLLGDILEEYRGILPWNNEVIKNKLSDEKKTSSQSTWYRLKRYMNDFWNSLDVLFYCITIAAILVRFLYTASTIKLARRLYSLSLFMMYMRFLHALLMSRSLGPKIIMIKEMLKDLFRFIGILFIFMIGVGVLYHANMYPAHYDMWNKAGWKYWRIWKIMYIPYWQIYGELFLDTFQDNSTTPCTTIQSEWESNPDIERCNQYDWVLILIAALYMLMSNLLLVNLVIALFSYRFEIVQNNSEKLWRYWRYAVIMDYRQRFPAPLNLMIRPFMLVKQCVNQCGKTCCKDKELDNNAAIERMKRIQSISANKCIRQEL